MEGASFATTNAAAATEKSMADGPAPTCLPPLSNASALLCPNRALNPPPPAAASLPHVKNEEARASMIRRDATTLPSTAAAPSPPPSLPLPLLPSDPAAAFTLAPSPALRQFAGQLPAEMKQDEPMDSAVRTRQTAAIDTSALVNATAPAAQARDAPPHPSLPATQALPIISLASPKPIAPAAKSAAAAAAIPPLLPSSPPASVFPAPLPPPPPPAPLRSGLRPRVARASLTPSASISDEEIEHMRSAACTARGVASHISCAGLAGCLFSPLLQPVPPCQPLHERAEQVWIEGRGWTDPSRNRASKRKKLMSAPAISDTAASAVQGAAQPTSSAMTVPSVALPVDDTCAPTQSLCSNVKQEEKAAEPDISAVDKLTDGPAAARRSTRKRSKPAPADPAAAAAVVEAAAFVPGLPLTKSDQFSIEAKSSSLTALGTDVAVPAASGPEAAPAAAIANSAPTPMPLKWRARGPTQAVALGAASPQASPSIRSLRARAPPKHAVAVAKQAPEVKQPVPDKSSVFSLRVQAPPATPPSAPPRRKPTKAAAAPAASSSSRPEKPMEPRKPVVAETAAPSASASASGPAAAALKELKRLEAVSALSATRRDECLPRLPVHELRLPPDWSIKQCDVCIIGAGAAGIQCAESLSKLASPVGSASLSIVLLEGRDRIGGRIKTEMRKHAGGDVAVEHGAAFIHGCDGDGQNLAFSAAVEHNLPRVVKDDFREFWAGNGIQVSELRVFDVRKKLEEVDGILARRIRMMMNRSAGVEEESLGAAGNGVAGASAQSPTRMTVPAASAASVPARAMVDLTLTSSSSDSESSGSDEDSHTSGSSSSSNSSDSDGDDSDDGGSSKNEDDAASAAPANAAPPVLPQEALGPAPMDLSEDEPKPRPGSSLAHLPEMPASRAASLTSVQHSRSPPVRKRRRVSPAGTQSEPSAGRLGEGLEKTQGTLNLHGSASAYTVQKPDNASSIAASAPGSASLPPPPSRQLRPRNCLGVVDANESKPDVPSALPLFRDREQDVSLKEVFDASLAEYERLRLEQDRSPLTDVEHRMLQSMVTSSHGYVCQLDKMSAFDSLDMSAGNGGERALTDGYLTLLNKLFERVQSRAARGQIQFELLLQHPVGVIEQLHLPARLLGASSGVEIEPSPPDTNSRAGNYSETEGAAAAAASSNAAVPAAFFALPSAPYALVLMPLQRVAVACRFVVSTASVGILQNSLRFDVDLAQRHAHLLQQPPERPHTYTTSLKRSTSPGLGHTGGANRSASSSGAAATLASPASSAPPPAPLVRDLQAAMLFHPPLSPRTVEAVERLGMGLENKIICEWLPGSRFWPSYVHQLRSVNFPHVRFYVPGGIFRRADVDILVAHLPPPWAYELESMSEAQVQQLVLDVLSDMFSTELNGGPVRPKSSERYAPMEDVDTNAEPASAGIALEQFSDEDDEQFYARKEEHSRQLKARKELRRTGKRQDAEARRDEVWRRKPVVAPHSITVTRWSQDPFALGAYSCVPTKCDVILLRRLKEPQPQLSSARLAEQAGNSAASEEAGVLYLAGEATDDLDVQQVHGAMSSGQRAARQIQQRLEQQLTRAFPDRLPAPAAALGTKHKKPPRRRLKRNRVPDSEDEAEAKQTEIGVG